MNRLPSGVKLVAQPSDIAEYSAIVPGDAPASCGLVLPQPNP